MSIDNIVDQLNNYANMRSFSIKCKTKKITFKMLRDEICISRLLGELSAAEKVLQAIVDNKDWDRDMIEAELHMYITELNNMTCGYLKSDRFVDIEDILREYGYYDKQQD